MTGQDRQIGKLSGQMEMVVESLKSLHIKMDAYNDRCGPCRKEIEDQSIRIATMVTKDSNKSIKIWVIGGVLSVLAIICGYMFLNHFMPDVRNTQIEAVKK